jgi:hypothetical protein
MPEMLPPNAATFVAVPAAARPVAPRQGPVAAPQAPADPFRPEPGPPVLLLPHAADGGPRRQGRAGSPERLAAAQAPAGGLISRGVMYPAGEFLPDLPPGLPAPPAPRRPVRERLRQAVRRRHQEG